jgi:hypothetical protein
VLGRVLICGRPAKCKRWRVVVICPASDAAMELRARVGVFAVVADARLLRRFPLMTAAHYPAVPHCRGFLAVALRRNFGNADVVPECCHGCVARVAHGPDWLLATSLLSPALALSGPSF